MSLGRREAHARSAEITPRSGLRTLLAARRSLAPSGPSAPRRPAPSPARQVDMPVFFYIDPEFLKDRRMRKLDNMCLSYTFFKSNEIYG